MLKILASPARALPAAAAVTLLALVSAVVGPAISPASAATSRGQCYYFTIDGLGEAGDTTDDVTFHNYDYLSEEDNCNAVDWATSLVFFNLADINHVKDILIFLGYPGTSFDGMHMPTKDVFTELQWDRDGGKKGTSCPAVGFETRHYRVYAPPLHDYMYTMDWGFFVVGSTHWDANECPPIGKRHYDSEEVEDSIVLRMAQEGYPVYPDAVDFLNYEPYRVEGNHEWNNNGYASFINIP